MKTIKKLSLLSILLMVMVACNTKDKEDQANTIRVQQQHFTLALWILKLRKTNPENAPFAIWS